MCFHQELRDLVAIWQACLALLPRCTWNCDLLITVTIGRIAFFLPSVRLWTLTTGGVLFQFTTILNCCKVCNSYFNPILGNGWWTIRGCLVDNWCSMSNRIPHPNKHSSKNLRLLLHFSCFRCDADLGHFGSVHQFVTCLRRTFNSPPPLSVGTVLGLMMYFFWGGFALILMGSSSWTSMGLSPSTTMGC